MISRVHYTYRFRIYPNKAQREYLARVFGCARYIYNWAKELCSSTYEETGETLSVRDTQRRLTQYKKQDEVSWLNNVSNAPLQQALADLGRAYTNFFKGRAKYPRFKRKRSRQSARFVGSSFKLIATPYGPKLHLARMPRGPKIKVNWHRPMDEDVSSCTVVQESDGSYYVTCVTERAMPKLPRTNAAVGIDLGLTDAIVTSDRWKSGNPRFLRQAQQRLKREQRSLSRKKVGSNRWRRQKKRVARAYAKVKSARRTWIHKQTTRIVEKYDVICVETLGVKNLMRNHCLAFSIGDVAWSEIVRQLEYKSGWYGKELVKIDRFFPSSKTCSACGHERDQLPLSVRQWTCEECGAEHDRDFNAAQNICRVGLTLTGSLLASKARGQCVRPCEAPNSRAVLDEA